MLGTFGACLRARVADDPVAAADAANVHIHQEGLPGT